MWLLGPMHSDTTVVHIEKDLRVSNIGCESLALLELIWFAATVDGDSIPTNATNLGTVHVQTMLRRLVAGNDVNSGYQAAG
jgi:hypothetical protein